MHLDNFQKPTKFKISDYNQFYKMDENYEAAILQSFIQLQATKHGDHLLKALPVIASSMPAIASSVPAIASSKQAYGSSHQPTQVIIKPKVIVIISFLSHLFIK